MDIILYNGKVCTLDNEKTIAEAIGIKGNKIEFVGKNEEVLQLKTKKLKL